jgi:hypothetical protein
MTSEVPHDGLPMFDAHQMCWLAVWILTGRISTLTGTKPDVNLADGNFYAGDSRAIYRWTRANEPIFREWEHILSATYLPWTVAIPELPEREAFQGWVRRWWIDDILLADSRCGPCSGSPTRHQLADTEGEFVVVMIIQTGAETVGQRHIEATITRVTSWHGTAPGGTASPSGSHYRCAAS